MKTKSDNSSNYQSKKSADFDNLYSETLQEKMDKIKRLHAMVLEYEVLTNLAQMNSGSGFSELEERRQFIELYIRWAL